MPPKRRSSYASKVFSQILLGSAFACSACSGDGPPDTTDAATHTADADAAGRDVDAGRDDTDGSSPDSGDSATLDGATDADPGDAPVDSEDSSDAGTALCVPSDGTTGGVRDFAVCSGAGGLEVIEPFEGQWRSGDFKLGDALVFHSMNVHKSLDNRSDSIRHSMDPRYQRADQPILEVSMRPYSGCGGWDEIYADWASDELKYYWRRQDPTVEAFDWQYYERRDEMAFALAEQGDETARATLMRIVQRDPTPEKQARASSVLATLDRHAAGA